MTKKMIYFLLGILITLFVNAFFISNEDILAPSVIVCIMWIFSTICAIYNIDKWGIDLHLNTVGVVTIGLLSFIFGGVVGKRIPSIKTRNKEKQYDFGLSIINVWKPFLFFLLFVNFITVILQLKWVLSQVGSIAVWSDMMTAYRSSSTSWSTDSISKPSIHSNLETFLAVTAYITTYIGINNIFAGQKSRKQVYLFLPGLLYAVDKILNAGRGDILLYIGAIVLTIYICMQSKYKWTKKVSRSYIKYMIIGVVLVTLLFSASRSWVGRTNESNTMDYITTYAGGSVQLFDLYMQNPEPSSDIVGRETFHTLINYWGRVLNIPEWKYIAHLEFRYSNGINLGNVYGAFRYYLYDFGFLGVIILSFMASVFYTNIYEKIKKGRNNIKYGFNWTLIFYMYLGPSLFMFSIADYTYALLFNFVALFKWFLFAWIIKRILVNRAVPIKF